MRALTSHEEDLVWAALRASSEPLAAAASVITIWIAVTGPDGQAIELNTKQIVTLRSPRSAEHFGHGVRCLIHTADGKYVATMETCEMVQRLFQKPD